MLRLKGKTERRKGAEKFVAITEETVFALTSFPKDARLILQQVIPAFDRARKLPPSPTRWLAMLHMLPDDVLLRICDLRDTKPKQAAHLIVMMCVYARCLLSPLDDTGVRCEITNADMHRTSNRIYLMYLPLEHAIRQGYVEAELPSDPFAEWEEVKFRYTAAGVAQGEKLVTYNPDVPTVAGVWMDVPLEKLEIK